MRKSAGFVVVALAILTLGIGGSTAVFAVLYQVLLKPLPYPHAERLVFVHNSFPKSQVSTAGVSGFDYAAIKRHTDVFSSGGVYYWNDLTLTGLGAPRHINVVNASASVFDVLAVNPRLGRTFSQAEDEKGAAGTVVLSDGMWRGTFGGNAQVLGRVIHLNGAPYTVIGVMPPEFQFPSRETELWIPVALRRGEFTIEGGRMEKWLHMVARLDPRISLQRARAVLLTMSDELGAKFGPFYPRKEGWQFTLRQVGDEQTENIRAWLYLAFGAVFSLLLIGCINLSGLLLIRGTARTGEIAIRMAMGASKRRIVGQLLTEAGVLVVAGCATGFPFALWMVHAVNLYGPLGQPISVQGWTLVFVLALALVSTICAGLLPALLNAYAPIEESLKGGATRTATSGSRLRNAIVAAQIALAVVLLFTAMELNRSFLNLTRVPAGFQQSHVWTGALDLPSRNNAGFFEALLEKLRSLPGVRAASGGGIPFNPSGLWTEALRLPGQPKSKIPQEAQIGLPFPGYFEAMGIPLLRGRTFKQTDRAGTPPVAIIDQELARRYFAGEEPVGKLIASGGEETPARIVGVVGSVHNSDLGGPAEPEVYYPALRERPDSTYLVLRIEGDGDPSAAVRGAIAKLDSGAALYDVQLMENRVAASLKLRRFVAFLLNGLAASGMVLAIIGLYGSLAHLVQLRQREIGIRVALGALRWQVVRMILARAGLVCGSGMMAGVIGAVIAGRAIRHQLFGVQLTDAAGWVGVVGGIAIASAVAAYVPAWRAARIEPSDALRHE
jgi:putative ABC transport system permease protein